MKRIPLLLLLGLALLATPISAGPRGRYRPLARPTAETGRTTVDIEFLTAAFDADRSIILRYSRYGLNTQELALVFYLGSVGGRPLSEAEVRYIARERDWTRLAWYYGLPPVVFEDGLFVFRRPWRARIHPPLGLIRYKDHRRGWGEESLEIGPGWYAYKYENKRARVEEKIEITEARYEYKYEDRSVEERIFVDLRTYWYRYQYRDWRTGREIKRTGWGRPLTPDLIYRQLSAERKRKPDFRLDVTLKF